MGENTLFGEIYLMQSDKKFELIMHNVGRFHRNSYQEFTPGLF